MSTVRKLRDLAIVAAGQGAPQGEENYCTNGIPFIKAGNLIELLNGKKERDIQNVSEEVAKQYRLKLYPAGTVLFAKSGMSCMKGYVYVLQSDCYVVSHLACIIPIETTGTYLKYYFEYHRPNSLIKDEAYPSISLSDIGNLDIRLETPVKQAAIVNNLDRINALIKCRKAQLHKIDDLVKSQFIETFLNRGFQRVALEKVSHGKGEYGAASASVEYIPSRPRYVRITDINDDGTLNDDRVCSVNLSDDSDYKLEYGDFLFARMGATVGKTYVYKTGNQIFAGYLIRYKLNTDKINPYYLYSYTKTPEYESWVQLNQSGAAQPGINAKKYGSLQIPLPPMALQNQFAAFVEQTDKSKVLMEQARKLVQILIKLILNIGTIEKSIQICYNGHRKEGV